MRYISFRDIVDDNEPYNVRQSTKVNISDVKQSTKANITGNEL